MKHGGAEKQTVTDANLFSEKHSVILVTFKDGELKSLLNEKVKLILVDKKGYISTAKKIRNIIIEEKIQAINASLFASMIISVLSANKIDVPVFWYFHSHEYDMQFSAMMAFNYYSRKKCLKKIFFVSTELKNSIINKGIKLPGYKQAVLYNSYTVDSILSNRNNKSNDKVIIGYIGRLVELKRVEYLIELAGYLKSNRIDNFRIDIIGDGKSRQKLVEYSKELNVEDYVNILGYHSEVGRYYDSFDIFVLPSREECLSLALIDAGVKAVPCVAFDIGGNNEIVIDSKSGFLVNTKEELFSKTELLITDRIKRLELGKEAEIYCKSKFDTVKRYNYLENVFKNLN
ncbi:MAG: glycosyltransferase family 4 protein [Ignavibacteriae bacterium]|nr:glycosyltransferase family 4 protein [Ignavibacteriota bacterium]